MFIINEEDLKEMAKIKTTFKEMHMSKGAIVEQMKQNFLGNTMEDIQSTFIPGLFHLKNLQMKIQHR